MTNNSRQAEFSLALVILLGFGHFVADFYAGMLSPLLPTFVERWHLSLAMAGTIYGIFSISSSLVQPLLGFVGDRLSRTVFLVMGLMASSIFMCLITLSPSPFFLCVFLLIGGMGVSLFHPHGAALASAVAGKRKSFWMAVFMVGGTLGISSSPLLIKYLILKKALNWLWLMAVPGVLAALAFSRFSASKVVQQERVTLRELATNFRKRAGTTSMLFSISFLRSFTITGLMSFVPIWLDTIGKPKGYAQTALSVYLFLGGVGLVVGGLLSEHTPPRLHMFAANILAVPAFLLFLRANNGGSYFPLAMGSFFMMMAASVTLVMAQDLHPENASTISGFMMGFAWGTAGFLMPILGWFADHFGALTALRIAVLPLVLAAILSLLLPSRRLDHHQETITT